jgi:hypothetical protein
MDIEQYKHIRATIAASQFREDIVWAEGVRAPETALLFAREHCFVVCNSGMNFKSGTAIFNRVWDALTHGRDPYPKCLNNEPKCRAMRRVYRDRVSLFKEWQALQGRTDAVGKLRWLMRLPYIGEITRFHLAKNFGVDVAKPDRHLVRIAAHFQTDPHSLCARLSQESGDRINTVDVVLWRAAATGIISTYTDGRVTFNL